MTPTIDPPPDVANKFQRQLTVATLGLLFVVLVILLLEKFAAILQPLLIAVLAAYVLMPVHRWLVRRGVRSKLAYALMLAVLLGLSYAAALGLYSSVMSVTEERLAAYQTQGGRLLNRGAALVNLSGPDLQQRLRGSVGPQAIAAEDVIRTVRGAVGTFFSFLTGALVVVVYLVFLAAERLTFPQRLALAFGDQRATHLLVIVLHINEAIANYIAVKTWASFVTGLLSLLVLAAFGVEFAVLWGVLIFLLNYIPYLGSLVATAPPILLSFVQFEEPWVGLAVTAALVAVQLFTGQYLEPRMAGKRLNLSPLLILLALAFWGSLWGVVGMILAVPLTVVCKIILDNIPETRPVGALMSNV